MQKTGQGPEVVGNDRKDGYDRKGEGLRTQDLEANTELRHSAFLRVESVVMAFEEREGMEGVHTPDIHLTRCHQVLKEGDKF